VVSRLTVHVPILVRPIVDTLIEPFRSLPASAPSHWIVDCTLGGGGHTAQFLAALAALEPEEKCPRHKVLAVDQDPSAIDRARVRFAREIAEGRLELLQSRFSGISLSDRPVLGLMADLGFSSDQIESADRGLSFQLEGPLDMRLDPTSGMSARDYLAQVTEAELQEVLQEYGEERFSRRIAQAILRERGTNGVPQTTKALADVISRAVPSEARYGRLHPATRTFQALRIEVNGELNELDTLLSHVILGVQPGGRVAILSFHSLEDRKVKNAFRAVSREDRARARFIALTKKPIEADDLEISTNPRSRSAKLRIGERTSNP